MAGALEIMMKGVMKKTMEESYPQAQLPAFMKARVTKVMPLSETYRLAELQIEDKAEERSFEAEISGKWFEYSLKILAKNEEDDSQYPVIPGVKSTIQVESGTIVAVALLYGELSPFILGEVR